MKLGILTLPLQHNYGGILQCYALQTALRRLGHDVTVIRRMRPQPTKTCKDFFMDFAKCLTHIFLGKQHTYFPTPKETERLQQYTQHFIDTYVVPSTPLLYSSEALKEQCLKDKYEGYIVGSDQVWRPRYTACIYDYYLDFLKETSPVKRIAYAASFGTDTWEYNQEETQHCRALAQLFDAVSVRETSAIHICQQYLDVNAVNVLDPTLLLDRTDYIELVNKEKEPISKGELFYYILDMNTEKKHYINSAAQEMSLTAFTAMPSLSCHVKENMQKHIDECTYPSVTQWLRAFMDAKMVITDSFHGCVFAIIFNKPFWVILNEERGLARFYSLLRMFHLENRIIASTPQETIHWDTSIDWTSINSILDKYRKDSFNFIIQSLSDL